MADLVIRPSKRQNFNTTKLLELLSDGKFADFELTCGNHTFRLHRSIICTQSEYLDRMAGGVFRESVECRGKLSEEEPALVARFIMFLYTGWYEQGDLASASCIAQFKDIEDKYAAEDEAYGASKLHVNMIGLAHRLCEDRLREHCLRRFAESFWRKRERYSLATDAFRTRGEVIRIKLEFKGHPVLKKETELDVGLENTGAEFCDYVTEVSNWAYVTAKLGGEALKYLRNNPKTLCDMGFSNGEEIQIVNKGKTQQYLDQLQFETMERGIKAIFDPQEHELINLIHESKQEEPLMWEMVCLEYTYKRITRAITPCQSYEDLVRSIPDLCFDVEMMHLSDQFFKCAECRSLQLLKVHVCKCHSWVDQCEECFESVPKDTICFNCFAKGTLEQQDLSFYRR